MVSTIFFSIAFLGVLSAIIVLACIVYIISQKIKDIEAELEIMDFRAEKLENSYFELKAKKVANKSKQKSKQNGKQKTNRKQKMINEHYYCGTCNYFEWESNDYGYCRLQSREQWAGDYCPCHKFDENTY